MDDGVPAHRIVALHLQPAGDVEDDATTQLDPFAQHDGAALELDEDVVLYPAGGADAQPVLAPRLEADANAMAEHDVVRDVEIDAGVVPRRRGANTCHEGRTSHRGAGG